MRRQAEERILEIRHRLVVEVVCGTSGLSPGLPNLEEELLDELRELERRLAAEETRNYDPRAEHWEKSRETLI